MADLQQAGPAGPAPSSEHAGATKPPRARIDASLIPLLLTLLLAPLLLHALGDILDRPLVHPSIDILLVGIGLACIAVLWQRIRSSDRRVAAERERAHADRDRLSVAVGRERATLASVIASMSEGLAILDADSTLR